MKLEFLLFYIETSFLMQIYPLKMLPTDGSETSGYSIRQYHLNKFIDSSFLTRKQFEVILIKSTVKTNVLLYCNNVLFSYVTGTNILIWPNALGCGQYSYISACSWSPGV